MNKEEWTRVCDLFASEEFQRRSAINRRIEKAKLKIVHTSGARSFQRARALLKNPESDEISAVLLYKKTHTNKDGMWTSEDARENFEKMEALQLQYESEGKSYTEVEIFAEVLGQSGLRARFRLFSTTSLWPWNTALTSFCVESSVEEKATIVDGKGYKRDTKPPRKHRPPTNTLDESLDGKKPYPEHKPPHHPGHPPVEEAKAYHKPPVYKPPHKPPTST
ncbi:hypothetical protein CJ030_MR1G002131 [Morella rubra]|uniref:Uncharacterized protein n=1 Tax=Morella rubra TaxID=262757 RepID=A0A6A1WR28_9ROSI|nr:hypothetical protein CJ030_MR1G002131 [Morella rubra]